VRSEARYSIRRSGSGGFEVVLDETLLHATLDPSEALAWLLWHVNQETAARSDRFLLLHAACVELKGRALLLAGEAGAGKSTTCAALVQAGARYVTDELTALEPAASVVVPFPKALNLGAESLRALSLAMPVVPGGVSGAPGAADAHVPPATLAADAVAAGPCVPGWIVFPHYDANAVGEVALDRIRSSDALVELLAHTVNLERHGGRGLELLAALVDRCGCYRLAYADAAAAAAAVTAEIAPRP
jgi:hypothetical protein